MNTLLSHPNGLLVGKTALVTGGRQGIGRAIIDGFAAHGATIITCGRGPRPVDLPPSIGWQCADISDPHAVANLAERVQNEYGTLSILVNNAGVQIEKNILDSTDQDWDLVIGTNAKGVFLVCRAFIPILQTGASIINIGSISARVADHGMALYNASKAFVHGLTRSIAVDHGPQLRCNAICPGWIMTDMAQSAFALADDPAAARSHAIKRHPAGRLGLPDDIASMAIWLASDASSFATGQLFTVDGGLTAASPLNMECF